MTRVLYLMVGITILACAAGIVERRVQSDIVVAVDNLNWSDMVLYTVRFGTRTRLGSVTSFTRAYFEVPAWRAPDGQLVIQADPIGGTREYTLGPIMAAPGQQVLLTLHNHLPLSSWVVR